MIVTGHVHGNMVSIDQHDAPLKDGMQVEIIPLQSSGAHDDLCGVWKDDRPAEDIVRIIHNARSNSVWQRRKSW